MYGALESTSSSTSSENVIGYVNGFEYTGDYHLMPDGTMMTGASHGMGSDEIIYPTMQGIISVSYTHLTLPTKQPV